jgi:RHS repeat-associated protein
MVTGAEGAEQAISYVGGTAFSRTNQDGEIRYYLDGLEVFKDKPASYSFAEGRLAFRDGEAHFQYRIADHLGNTVVLFEDENDDGLITDNPSDPEASEVLQRKLYYPFGMELRGTSPVRPVVAQRYLYNGKELVEGIGLYDYGARWYDGEIGRFLGVDPLAHKMPAWSPYSYGFNNPLFWTDPTGMAPESPIFGRDGEFLGVDSEGYNGDVIVMDADKYKMLSNNGETTLDHGQVMKWAEFSPHAQTLENSGISAEAVSNVLTHVTKQTDGVNFNRLEGGIINTIDTQNDDDGLSQVNGDRFGNPTNPPINATAMEVTNPDGSINVTTRMLFGQSPMNTVEHIQSTLGIHEYKGHGLLNIGGGADEKRSYRLEYNNKAIFNKLTPGQQNLIKQNAKIK